MRPSSQSNDSHRAWWKQEYPKGRNLALGFITIIERMEILKKVSQRHITLDSTIFHRGMKSHTWIFMGKREPRSSPFKYALAIYTSSGVIPPHEPLEKYIHTQERTWHRKSHSEPHSEH